MQLIFGKSFWTLKKKVPSLLKMDLSHCLLYLSMWMIPVEPIWKKKKNTNKGFYVWKY